MSLRFLLTLLLLPNLILLVTCKIYYLEDFGGLSDEDFISSQNLPENAEQYYENSWMHTFPRVYNLTHHTSNHGLYKPIENSLYNNKQLKDDLTDLCLKNKRAFNHALDAIESGDELQIRGNLTYSLIGGIWGENLKDITLNIEGKLRFLPIRDSWATTRYKCDIDNKKSSWCTKYLDIISIVNSRNVTLTCINDDYCARSQYEDSNIVLKDGYNGGIVDGHGPTWWEEEILGVLPKGDSRPLLLNVTGSTDVQVSKLTLINSPFWSLRMQSIRAQVHHVTVLIDRNYQRSLKLVLNKILHRSDNHPLVVVSDKRRRRHLRRTLTSHLGDEQQLKLYDPFDPQLQPMDLNTDGIDPCGRDIDIHDCIIMNDDDSVAVKPSNQISTALHGSISFNCTENITVRNSILTGFGASVGSVGPIKAHNCVNNILFENITMPNTGKGIYIKSNKSNCHRDKSSRLTNIIYRNIKIIKPVWWAIWIGPQQQHQPHQDLDGACCLHYPYDCKCPTQGCATFENITLQNVYVKDSVLSPGVILGNSTNPILNLVFDKVVAENSGHLPFPSKHFPFDGTYKCVHAIGKSIDSSPIPECLSH